MVDLIVCCQLGYYNIRGFMFSKENVDLVKLYNDPLFKAVTSEAILLGEFAYIWFIALDSSNRTKLVIYDFIQRASRDSRLSEDIYKLLREIASIDRPKQSDELGEHNNPVLEGNIWEKKSV